MDDDLDGIVSILEETVGECGLSLVADEWGFAEGEETGEHILPFNFDIALSVVEESGDTIDEEILTNVSFPVGFI